ncbi:hypothetical protein D3C85_1642550 [compost metagenome]
MSRKGKVYACAGMAVGYLIFLWSAHPSLPLSIGVGVFFLASAAYVLSRPRPKDRDPGDAAASE